MNDMTRAALIAAIESLFPVLLILGVIDLTMEEIGVVMLAITNAVTLVALVMKKGQQPGGV